MNTYYTLTFIPSNNKNIYYTKLIAKGSKEQVEKVLYDIIGRPLVQICDPFCEIDKCEYCDEKGGCNQECDCFKTDTINFLEVKRK